MTVDWYLFTNHQHIYHIYDVVSNIWKNYWIINPLYVDKLGRKLDVSYRISFISLYDMYHHQGHSPWLWAMSQSLFLRTKSVFIRDLTNDNENISSSKFYCKTSPTILLEEILDNYCLSRTIFVWKMGDKYMHLERVNYYSPLLFFRVKQIFFSIWNSLNFWKI